MAATLPKGIWGRRLILRTTHSPYPAQSHQMEQLKEEIRAKDLGLVKQHFDAMRLEKERDVLLAQLARVKQQVAEQESAIQANRAEGEKLSQMTEHAEQVRRKHAAFSCMSWCDELVWGVLQPWGALCCHVVAAGMCRAAERA